MPLLKFSAESAVNNRKTNALAGWPDRGTPNRVEPVATPGFDVPFKLEPGEPIFTVGSCFARNVEVELARRGFEIPVREYFSRPEFSQLEFGIINNYGTPSIYNEIAWAFGERDFVVDDHIIEIMPGKFVDQHISPALRPESRDGVLARRAAITDIYRSATTCRTIIMTLGLSEVWFDTQSGYYLNVSPRPAAIRKYPDRYELHVLSYEEAYGFLRDALLLLQKRGRPDLRILLTVSPVPLMATHRPADVLVANTYSKAVLRTAAETVITTMPFVHYYPSFEGVNLSDRKIAWLDDMTHVSDAIVQVQVARMVEAFVGSTAADDAKAIAAGGETMAIERARNARSTGGKAADEFFVEHVDWSSRSTIFALEHARHLLNRRLPEEALKILDPHAASEDVAIAAARCEALLAAGQADAALAVLDVVDGKRIKSNTLWDALLKAALGAGDRDAITSVLNRLMKYTPARSAASLMHVARHFRDQGDIDSAIRYYQNSVDRDRRNVTLIELADVLVTARRADEARDLLTGLRAENSGEAKRLQRLTDLLGLRQLA